MGTGVRLATSTFAVGLVVLAACDDSSTIPQPEVPVWNKYAGNPILSPGAAGSWDATSVGTPSVLKLDADNYMMWYTGSGTSGRQIGLAVSNDGITWTKHVDNPALTPGSAATWDDREVAHPSVRYDGSVYTMHYTGYGPDGGAIGFATSDDGVHWTRSAANPVLTASNPGTSWDDAGVFSPSVLVGPGGHEMWYAGAGRYPAAIGFASSDDGISWNKLLSPVLHPEVLEALTFSPCVIKSGTNYRMWHGALHESASGGVQPGVIDYAQSQDGIEWTSRRAILSPGRAGSWDAGAVKSASVVDDGASLRMWYEGAAVVDGNSDPVGAIGFATFGQP